MRITAGSHKGRKLIAPTGFDIRPTSDMVRQAVFNMLYARGLPAGAHVIDVFCGTGALGFEALSRGAASCVMVDISRESLTLARDNAETLGLSDACTFILKDATQIGMKPAGQPAASLIFLDPPYRKGLIKPTLGALAVSGWLAAGAVCVCEHEPAAPDDVPPEFRFLQRKTYGEKEVSLYEYEQR